MTIAPAAKDRLESLFHPVAPKAEEGHKPPPPRPCGCRTWFQTKTECPYCKKRILRGRIEK